MIKKQIALVNALVEHNNDSHKTYAAIRRWFLSIFGTTYPPELESLKAVINCTELTFKAKAYIIHYAIAYECDFVCYACTDTISVYDILGVRVTVDSATEQIILAPAVSNTHMIYKLTHAGESHNIRIPPDMNLRRVLDMLTLHAKPDCKITLETCHVSEFNNAYELNSETIKTIHEFLR